MSPRHKRYICCKHTEGMNRHFSHAWYYMKRSGRHLRAGLSEEFAPLTDRVRSALGREQQAEPKRLERVQMELRRAEGKGKHALKDAKGRIDQYRGTGMSPTE